LTADRPPFRVAYLILSHHRPEQVEALTRRILTLSPEGHVVVHHDASASTTPWNGAPPGRVHLLTRQRVLWGDWSMVETSLRLLQFAAEELNADWCAFLSGEDRPVLDLARWERKLASTGIDGLVPATPVDRKPVFGRSPTAGDVNFTRYSYRWREIPPVGGAARSAVELARRVSRYAQPLFKIEYTNRRERFFVGFPRRRRLPAGWTLYTGPQWVACSRRSMEALLAVDDTVIEWYRQTWIPDQSFFQTVLYNQPGLVLDRSPLTYVVSFRDKQERGDMVLRASDLEVVRQSGAAFARKFDPSVDAEILRVVDAEIDAEVESDVEVESDADPAPS
jgi:hypothetical protein